MVCRAIGKGTRRDPRGKIPYLTGIVSFGPDKCGVQVNLCQKLCSKCQNKNKNKLCTQHVLSLLFSCKY